jgi:hypothetical protein
MKLNFGLFAKQKIKNNIIYDIKKSKKIDKNNCRGEITNSDNKR